jgi:Flp pilus assembly pilin Flp
MLLVSGARSFREFWIDDSATTAVEYAVIAGVISICIAAGTLQIQGSLKGWMTVVQAELKAATN